MSFNFPHDAIQQWENRPGQPVNKAAVLNAFYSGALTPNDVSIAKFIFLHGYTTTNQMQTYFENEISQSQLKRRIQTMLKYRILNRFNFVDQDKNIISPLIYCLDMGGGYLLENQSNFDVDNWTPSENIRSPELIGRHLVASEFHVRIKEKFPELSFKFEPFKEIYFDRKKFKPTFIFELNEKVFLGEVIRGEEQLELLRDRMVRYDILLETNHYKRFWPEKPVLFLVSENDEVALKVAEIVENHSRINGYRLTTDERVSRGLSTKGAFLKHEAGLLKEVTAKIFMTGDGDDNTR